MPEVDRWSVESLNMKPEFETTSRRVAQWENEASIHAMNGGNICGTKHALIIRSVIPAFR